MILQGSEQLINTVLLNLAASNPSAVLRLLFLHAMQGGTWLYAFDEHTCNARRITCWSAGDFWLSTGTLKSLPYMQLAVLRLVHIYVVDTLAL